MDIPSKVAEPEFKPNSLNLNPAIPSCHKISQPASPPGTRQTWILRAREGQGTTRSPESWCQKSKSITSGLVLF